MPISAESDPSRPNAALGGFMTYPGGAFAPDPSSNVKGSALHPVSTTPYYDLAVHRWLPVPYQQISPDGLKYAYVEYTGQGPDKPQPLHVVEISSGRDTVLLTGQQEYDTPDWQPEGIYVRYHLAGTDFSKGLYLVDPATAAVVPIDTKYQDWAAIGAGSAWTFDTVDSKTFSKGGGDTILRLDLKTMAVSKWMFRASRNLDVLGADARGHPFVVDAGSADSGIFALAGVYHLTAAEAATKIYPATGIPDLLGLVGYQPDGVRTWLSSTEGVLLYTDGGRLQFVGGPKNAVFTGGCR